MNDPSPPANTIDPVQTLHFIDQHYSLDELRTLCFELGVDYDNLPGEGKKGKARELIMHESRRRGLAELTSVLSNDHQQAFARELAPAIRIPTTRPQASAPTLDDRQVTAVRAAVRAVAVALVEPGSPPAWNRVYADLRRTFRVASYRDIPATRFSDAIWFLEDWLSELEAS